MRSLVPVAKDAPKLGIVPSKGVAFKVPQIFMREHMPINIIPFYLKNSTMIHQPKKAAWFEDSILKRFSKPKWTRFLDDTQIMSILTLYESGHFKNPQLLHQLSGFTIGQTYLFNESSILSIRNQFQNIRQKIKFINLPGCTVSNFKFNKKDFLEMYHVKESNFKVTDIREEILSLKLTGSKTSLDLIFVDFEDTNLIKRLAINLATFNQPIPGFFMGIPPLENRKMIFDRVDTSNIKEIAKILKEKKFFFDIQNTQMVKNSEGKIDQGLSLFSYLFNRGNCFVDFIGEHDQNFETLSGFSPTFYFNSRTKFLEYYSFSEDLCELYKKTNKITYSKDMSFKEKIDYQEKLVFDNMKAFMRASPLFEHYQQGFYQRIAQKIKRELDSPNLTNRERRFVAFIQKRDRVFATQEILSSLDQSEKTPKDFQPLSFENKIFFEEFSSFLNTEELKDLKKSNLFQKNRNL